jgi:hypothetical protein
VTRITRAIRGLGWAIAFPFVLGLCLILVLADGFDGNMRDDS